MRSQAREWWPRCTVSWRISIRHKEEVAAILTHLCDLSVYPVFHSLRDSIHLMEGGFWKQCDRKIFGSHFLPFNQSCDCGCACWSTAQTLEQLSPVSYLCCPPLFSCISLQLSKESVLLFCGNMQVLHWVLLKPLPNNCQTQFLSPQMDSLNQNVETSSA